mgnify:CR=1 FL=1
MKNNFTFIKEVGLLNNDLAEKHLIKFDKIYQEKIYRNIDTNFCELKKSDILKYPLYLSLLDIIQKKFELITGFNDLSFEKLWLVNSLPNDSSKVNLPYVPHIDKRRYLKALIYLHDVSLKHGPIHLGKVKSTIDIEQKRKKLPKDYKEKKLNTIDVEHLIFDDITSVLSSDEPFLVRTPAAVIDSYNLPDEGISDRSEPLVDTVRNSEYRTIMSALDRSQNRDQAAEVLGISTRTLRHKLQRLREQGLSVTRAYAR